GPVDHVVPDGDVLGTDPDAAVVADRLDDGVAFAQNVLDVLQGEAVLGNEVDVGVEEVLHLGRLRVVAADGDGVERGASSAGVHSALSDVRVAGEAGEFWPVIATLDPDAMVEPGEIGDLTVDEREANRSIGVDADALEVMKVDACPERADRASRQVEAATTDSLHLDVLEQKIGGASGVESLVGTVRRDEVDVDDPHVRAVEDLSHLLPGTRGGRVHEGMDGRRVARIRIVAE